MASPPFGLSGVSSGWTTFWPGVSTTSAAIWAIVRPSTVGASRVEEPGPLEQLAHDQRHAARLVHVERGVASARPHVGDERRPVGDGPELVDVERDPVLVGDRQEMEHAVGRAAGRGHAGDPVLERLAGHDVLRPDVAPDEVHDQLAGPVGGRVLGLALGRDAVQARRREPDELHDRAHRVGRVLAAAGARSGAGDVLDLGQLVERDLARPVRPDGLVDAHDRDVALALVDARVDRPAVEDEARHVQAAERHGGRGHGLVAGHDAHDAVHQLAADDELDRVGDDLAADERGLHALRAHRHAVADRDRVELHGRPAGGPDAGLDHLGQVALVDVAGHRLDPGRRDADDRLGEILVGEADGLEHRPRAGPVRAVGQGGGMALGGVGRVRRVGHRGSPGAAGTGRCWP